MTQGGQGRGSGLTAPGSLVLIGILVLAFNLRTTPGAVGPLLLAITDGLGVGHAVAGLLTTLPVLCFAGFGALSPGLAARVGIHRVILGAAVLVFGGQLLRSATSVPVLFLLATAMALAGAAAANVLLPSLVKMHFGHRIGLVTALYSTCLTIGLAGASMLTVPIAQALGGWRWGLGIWALTAAATIVPWLFLVGQDRRLAAHAASSGEIAPSKISLAQVARTRLGWTMVFFFAVQSMHAYAVYGWLATMYQDAGFSPAASGFYLGIVAVSGIPLAFLLPAYTARTPRPRGLMIVIGGCLMLGYLGVLIFPSRLPWLWPILLAIGTAAFPVILTMLNLRARTGAGTSALSGFTQSFGYLLAAPGPFLVGLLHEASGTWVIPKLFLIVMSVPLLILGLFVARPRYLEDELPPPKAH